MKIQLIVPLLKTMAPEAMSIVPQTVLALRGSGVFKAGEPTVLLRGSRIRKIIKKPTVFKVFQKKWCWRTSFELTPSSF